jgi:hypothetical protein
MIGDAEYLKTLSGAKQKGSVRAWCRKNGIKTWNNTQGWPVTTAAALDRALTPGIESGPDWSAFDDKKTKTSKSPRKGRAVLLRRQEQVEGA